MSNYYKNPYSSFNEVAQKAMNRFYRNCLDATREQMNKIEVTDEMIDVAAYRLGVRVKDLHAALNPPPEPEIVVTEEMVGAAQYMDYKRIPDMKGYYTAIYRAMRKLEPKQ
jgi:hypothetical protein